jgi:hypothetical protein
MVTWAYGSLNVEGDTLVVRQKRWQKPLFGKRMDLPDDVTIYQVADVTLEVSTDGVGWKLHVRDNAAPSGLTYGGISDYEGLRALVERFSDRRSAIREFETWGRSPIDVRVVASISASGERLPLKCGGCGAPVTSSARFCGHCRSALG